jgi:hypothetical protein
VIALLLAAEAAQFLDAITYAIGVSRFDAASLGEASIVPMVIGPGGALAVKALLMAVVLVTVKRWWWRLLAVTALGFGAIAVTLNVLVMAGIA